MKQSTTWFTFAWLTQVSETFHVEMDKLPKLKNTKSNRRPKCLLAELDFLVVFNIKADRRLGDSVFDSIECRSNLAKQMLAGYHKKTYSENTGPMSARLNRIVRYI